MFSDILQRFLNFGAFFLSISVEMTTSKQTKFRHASIKYVTTTPAPWKLNFTCVTWHEPSVINLIFSFTLTEKKVQFKIQAYKIENTDAILNQNIPQLFCMFWSNKCICEVFQQH